MKWSEIPYEDLMALSSEAKWRLLCDGVRDDRASAEAALLLGSLTERAVERAKGAAALYHAGRVSKIIPTGAPLWPFEGGSYSEAEIMARVLMREGVPKDAIVLEEQAETTQENMICGMLQIMRTFGRVPGGVIIVTSVTHMARSLALARELLPRKMQISGYPTYPEQPFADWILDEANQKHVNDGVRLYKRLIDNGEVEDREISTS